MAAKNPNSGASSQSKRATSELLERFHLSRWAKAGVPALSGGMAQRLMTARAILHRPAILFLDEPTAGLDPIAATHYDELVKGLRDSLGLTVLMVTHDLDSLYAVCDRIAVLLDKRVVVGTMAEMLNYDHPWVREYFHGPRGRAAKQE